MSDTTNNPSRQGLSEDFVVPPFSILDARSGRWQARKRQWKAAGVGVGDVSRADLTFGRALNEFGDSSKALRESTSEFDPVLAETLIHWFSEPGDVVVDPFCGGPVRGVVANRLGRGYAGCDLRASQVSANRAAFPSLSGLWVVGKAQDDPLRGVRPGMVLTCPPYGPLERYSDDPSDLSNMERGEFVASFRESMRGPVERLRDGGFAVVVVGDCRVGGQYWALPRAAEETLDGLGLVLHSKLVLATRAGSAAIRARSQMEASRLPVACHQDVLVFVKGQPGRWVISEPADLVGQTMLWESA